MPPACLWRHAGGMSIPPAAPDQLTTLRDELRALEDEFAGAMTRMPQVLINVKGVDKHRVDGDEGVQAAVTEVQASLADEGRVLLRKSGTEPVVRVMVEAATHERAQESAERLSVVVKERLAL